MQTLTKNEKNLRAMLADVADVVEAYLVHGDVDLELWVAKARATVARVDGDDAEAKHQYGIIGKRSIHPADEHRVNMTEALDFVKTMAGMSLDGELVENDEPDEPPVEFAMEGDDSTDALRQSIQKARRVLTGSEEPTKA